MARKTRWVHPKDPCPGCDGLKYVCASFCRLCAAKNQGGTREALQARVDEYVFLLSCGESTLAALDRVGWSPSAAARWFRRQGRRPEARAIESAARAARVGRPGRDVEAARVDVRAWLAGMSA